MANYEKIMELRPEMADFFENRRKIGLRGDVLTYWPNIRNDSFTTDSAGFRHSTFNGETLSVSDCLRSVWCVPGTGVLPVRELEP